MQISARRKHFSGIILNGVLKPESLRRSTGIRITKEDGAIFFWKKNNSPPLSGFTDIHCHILPAIDDGAKDLAEARNMLELAYQSGTRQLFVTPHYYPEKFPYSESYYEEQLAAVQGLASAVSHELSVYSGSEIYFVPEVVELLKAGRLHTLNHSENVLLEFMPLQPFSYLQRGLQEVQRSGFRVILAHPERYLCLHDQVERVRQLREMGILVQVSSTSITGANGKVMQKLVNRWLKLEMVDFVASDAHNLTHRTPDLRSAAEIIKKKYGEEYMQALFFNNARTILLNEV